jgi:hypothetical protein
MFCVKVAMVEEECYYVENVGGGVDENISSTS